MEKNKAGTEDREVWWGGLRFSAWSRDISVIKDIWAELWRSEIGSCEGGAVSGEEKLERGGGRCRRGGQGGPTGLVDPCWGLRLSSGWDGRPGLAVQSRARLCRPFWKVHCSCWGLMPWGVCRASLEIKLVNPKGNQSWTVTGRSDAEVPIQATWYNEPASWKKAWCWARLRTRGEGATWDKLVGWHHQLNEHESEQIPGNSEGQGSLACCSLWGRKESDTTEAT